MERCLHSLCFTCSVTLLLVCCSLGVVHGGEACLDTQLDFTRIRCFETFGASNLDLYKVRRITLFQCVKACSDTECRSFLFDNRYGTCAVYRQKTSNSPDNISSVKKYFLKYHEEGNFMNFIFIKYSLGFVNNVNG